MSLLYATMNAKKKKTKVGLNGYTLACY